MVALQKQCSVIEPDQDAEDAHRSKPSQQYWVLALRDVQRQAIYAQDRLYWMLQLRDYLFLPKVSGDVSGDDLGNARYSVSDYLLMQDLAVRLCDWVIVDDICHILLNADAGLLSDEEYEKAIIIGAEACVQLGKPFQALQRVKGALLKHYQNELLLNCYRWVQYHDEQGSDPWQDCHVGELRLTPLASHHIDAFRWACTQQSDGVKSVAERCNLPNFSHDDDWLHWLQGCDRYPNHYLYAVLHQEWGFIGSVCLEVFNGTGFFYYWLGEDFQGHGFGPQAVAILLNLGEWHKGMNCCYAKVYDGNQASQKALEKIGFSALPIHLAAPYDNELLYYFGPDKTQRQWRDELLTLFADMDSDFRLEVTRESLLHYLT
ncbi:GNAT family N-acetyltransferase [Marinomonas transparens]|uniref:GNAT family N-acetyltransferase n=1 Tax=Marinomonas transparens TaxID=2795388 RepID=A0A934JU43_9GAMM|nr:GNAT family N-acetyltransferase [Marinomonas transparens]MBJ7539999.1 GNAT family N-acetyltransferase [Marinomonas transparens]